MFAGGFEVSLWNSKKILRRIEESRKIEGDYKDLPDFIHRTELPRAALLKVAAAGALDCFNQNVRDLIWHLEKFKSGSRKLLMGFT